MQSISFIEDDAKNYMFILGPLRGYCTSYPKKLQN